MFHCKSSPTQTNSSQHRCSGLEPGNQPRTRGTLLSVFAFLLQEVFSRTSFPKHSSFDSFLPAVPAHASESGLYLRARWIFQRKSKTNEENLTFVFVFALNNEVIISMLICAGSLLGLQVEGQVTPVNLPSSRGLSSPGSPASTITVRHVHLCLSACAHTATDLRLPSGQSQRPGGGLPRPGRPAPRQSHPAGGATRPHDLPAAPQLLAAGPAASRGG